MLTKGWPQQKRILMIRWIELPILWIPFSLFLQPPLSSPNKLRNKAAMVTGMEGMHGLSNVDSPRPDWLQLLPSAPLPAPEMNTESRRGTIPPGEQPAV